MDISTRLDFAALPAQVFAMLIDPGYQEEVSVACACLRSEASATAAGTHTSRTLPAPEQAARFTGPELTLVEDVSWSGAAADGSRTGDLHLVVAGQPVTLTGQLRLAPGGRGTTVQLTGDLKVAVPLLGRKLEQAAAPGVLAGFSVQQQVGDRWLSR